MNSDKTYLELLLFMRHNPKVRQHNVVGRSHSSVMTVLKGEFEYTFKGGAFYASKGETVFLPYSSDYTYRVTSEECEILQIVFDICDQNGAVALCEAPFKIADTSICEIMERLVEDGSLPLSKPTFKTVSDMYRILSLLFDKCTDKRTALQIYPALKYIEEYYTEKIAVEHLARLCALSQSQLRRLFNIETGMSPIEYKNALRIKAACDMLKFSSQNISEISAVLGFENPYIFSKLFKKYNEVSPMKYRKIK